MGRIIERLGIARPRTDVCDDHLFGAVKRRWPPDNPPHAEMLVDKPPNDRGSNKATRSSNDNLSRHS